MEAISPATFVIFFFLGNWKEGIMVYGFLFLWLLHYLYRSFIFSSIQRGRRNMPLVVMAFGMLFNLANGYLQGKYLFSLSPGLEKYSAAWLATPQFIVGVILFLAGFIIHIHSDSIIRNLRTQGEDNEYKIPRGGLFRVLSAPNYFGEIVEWTGWAVLTWSLPGAAFAFWTAANLLPRGVANHKWYKKTFPDYPQERKAILPFIL
jgi:steroid 5-alpha reductase family enzyme